MRSAFIVLLAGVMAGCAQGGGLWVKEGVSAEDRQRDMVDCRRQADAQAERESYATGTRTPIFEVDPSTGQVRESFRSQSQAAALSEKTRSEELYQHCMRARGYRQE